MRLAKILLVNFAVLVVVFLVAEGGARAYFTLKLCQSLWNCEASLLTRFNLLRINTFTGFTTRDPVLGYKTNPNFSGVIYHPPGWDNVYVSIDRNGFRRNTDDQNVVEHSGRKVLAVGDSFTFGDQVHNSETWPACLGQKTGFDVWNGGVSGYGATQAVLRAKVENARYGPFDTIIWSITVGSDFPRDQLAVRSNYSKPYVATMAGETMAKAPTQFDPIPDYLWLLGYSVLLKESLLPIILKGAAFDYDGRYTVPGENAAEIEDIVDFAVQHFVKISGTKRKLIILQYGPSFFGPVELEKITGRRKLIKNYGEKYHVPILDSFDHLYIPEKRNVLWFAHANAGHHTPYGNRVVCDIIVNWPDW